MGGSNHKTFERFCTLLFLLDGTKNLKPSCFFFFLLKFNKINLKVVPRKKKNKNCSADDDNNDNDDNDTDDERQQEYIDYNSIKESNKL